MADYKRTEVPEDVILHISPSRNTVVVQEHSANGVVSYREIDPIEFYFALNGSYTTNDYLDSGFLPEHCLHIAMNAAERRYVIWNPELRADVIYRDTEYLDFPLPRLVFSLRVLADGRVADCSMGVVADEPPTEDTPMFFYPFSNVHDNERVYARPRRTVEQTPACISLPGLRCGHRNGYQRGWNQLYRAGGPVFLSQREQAKS